VKRFFKFFQSGLRGEKLSITELVYATHQYHVMQGHWQTLPLPFSTAAIQQPQ
jgi:hypothetical protein